MEKLAFSWQRQNTVKLNLATSPVFDCTILKCMEAVAYSDLKILWVSKMFDFR